MPVRANIASSSLWRFVSRLGFLQESKLKRDARHYMEEMEIRPLNDELNAINLSGGNQQKTLLAKWLCAQPKVLIVDEPTRGVDVGAKAKIHADLRKMADEGIGVIVISSELPEVLGLSDRIAVFREGQLTTVLDRRPGHPGRGNALCNKVAFHNSRPAGLLRHQPLPAAAVFCATWIPGACSCWGWPSSAWCWRS